MDRYHKYAEDMKLLADAGLTANRFGIQWAARIEPFPDSAVRIRPHQLDRWENFVLLAVKIRPAFVILYVL